MQIKYRVYKQSDGCDESYCGEFDTLEEAEEWAENEPLGTPRFQWGLHRAAGGADKLNAPDVNGIIDEEPISWHGERGEHFVVKTRYPVDNKDKS